MIPFNEGRGHLHVTVAWDHVPRVPKEPREQTTPSLESRDRSASLSSRPRSDVVLPGSESVAESITTSAKRRTSRFFGRSKDKDKEK